MIILLICYLIFLAIYLVYSLVGIYHLWRFGYVGDLTRPAIILYVLMSAAIIGLSLLLIASRDWNSGLTL